MREFQVIFQLQNGPGGTWLDYVRQKIMATDMKDAVRRAEISGLVQFCHLDYNKRFRVEDWNAFGTKLPKESGPHYVEGE